MPEAKAIDWSLLHTWKVAGVVMVPDNSASQFAFKPITITHLIIARDIHTATGWLMHKYPEIVVCEARMLTTDKIEGGVL